MRNTSTSFYANLFGKIIIKNIIIPFNTPLIFKFDVEIIKPAITYNEKADKFASQVYP